jgi:hypothetical protein
LIPFVGTAFGAIAGCLGGAAAQRWGNPNFPP